MIQYYAINFCVSDEQRKALKLNTSYAKRSLHFVFWGKY